MGKKKSKTPQDGEQQQAAPEADDQQVEVAPKKEAKPKKGEKPQKDEESKKEEAPAEEKPKGENKPKPKPEPAGPPPDLRLLARGRGILQGFTGPEWAPCEGYALPPCDEIDVVFSQDGALLAAPDHSSERVNVHDAMTGQLRCSVPEPKVTNLYISPKNSFLVTQRRYEKDEVPNMAVWDLASGAELTRMYQSRWPALIWSADEGVCVRMTNNGIQAMNGANFAVDQGIGKLDNAKVDVMSLSPNLPPYLAVFTKQSKGQPAHVKVYKAPNLTDELMQKSMFKADSCSIFWNSQGTALIMNCKTDQDTSGQSYYGESLIYLILPKQKESMNITVGKSGDQVHDVAWAPNGVEFIVVSGPMPQNKATLFNMKGQVIFDFGTSPRNTVAWAPNSRFIALCGFGNLAGEIQFWDRKKLDKGNGKMATCKMNSCTAYEWSPDSRYFMCAITAPRMKVDNKIVIFKHNGVEVFSTPFPNELYQAEFKPEKARLFPNRDPSPTPVEHKEQQAAAAPVLFKARGSSGLSEMLRKERTTGGTGAIRPAYDNYIPGLPPPKPEGKKAKGKKAK